MSTQTQPQTTDQDLERRAALVRGLHELADFIAAHSEMPIPRYPDFPHCVSAKDDAAGMAELGAIAAALGVEISDEGSPDACRQFAGLEYKAFYVPRETMRRYEASVTYSDAVEPDDAQSERAA